MPRTDTTFTIRATMTGPLWWPIGAPASKPVELTFRRDEWLEPFVDNASTLAEAVEMLMRREGGDFSGPATLDGVLVVTRRGQRREVRRWFDLAFFGSIAEHVEREAVPA